MSEISLVPGIGIAASGLTAQRARLDAVMANIANSSTTRTASGEPYRRQVVELGAPGDVRVPEPPLLAPSTRVPLAVTDPAHRSRVEPPGVARTGRAGVEVESVGEDPTPFPVVYDPTHPDADAQGFVRLPNVELVDEMVDLMLASRIYEANLRSLEAAQSMAERTIDLGR